MAAGDITFFQEAIYIVDGGWATTNTVKLAILDNTTAPTAAATTPALADFTEVGVAGSYVAGGAALSENWGALWTQSAAVWTMDSATNPTWAQNGSNDTDAYWGLLHNDDQGDAGIGYVDLGGPVNMSTGDLTVTWNASGICTITIS